MDENKTGIEDQTVETGDTENNQSVENGDTEKKPEIDLNDPAIKSFIDEEAKKRGFGRYNQLLRKHGFGNEKDFEAKLSEFKEAEDAKKTETDKLQEAQDSIQQLKSSLESVSAAAVIYKSGITDDDDVEYIMYKAGKRFNAETDDYNDVLHTVISEHLAKSKNVEKQDSGAAPLKIDFSAKQNNTSPGKNDPNSMIRDLIGKTRKRG